MIPPGWNVTEPIGAAIKLLEYAERLREAPESAKQFKWELETIFLSLNTLETIFEKIESGEDDRFVGDGLTRLKKQVSGVQDCMKCCNKFIEKHVPLADGKSGKTAASRARWVWDGKKAKNFSDQIQRHVNLLNLSLGIDSLARRQTWNSTSSTPTLTPYTQSNAPEDTTPNPKTPADLLGLKLDIGTIEDPESAATIDTPSSSKRTSDASNTFSRPRPECRSNPSSDTTVFGGSTRSSLISPEIWARGGSLDGCLPGRSLQNLKNASMTLKRKGTVLSSISLEKIEAFEGFGTERRFILFSPASHTWIYGLDCTSSRAVIPNIKRPDILNPNPTHEIELSRIDFWKERLPLRNGSTTSSILDESQPVGSSAASIKSTSTSATTSSSSKFQEADQVFLKFQESRDDKGFQELLIGPDVELQAQIPLCDISSKYKGAKTGVSESKMQYVRLWRRGNFKYILFYANMSLETKTKYREYRMNHFKLEKSNKKSIKLCTDHLNSPLQVAPSMGLTRPLNTECLKDLEFLSINFETSKHQDFFLDRVKPSNDMELSPFFEDFRPGKK